MGSELSIKHEATSSCASFQGKEDADNIRISPYLVYPDTNTAEHKTGSGLNVLSDEASSSITHPTQGPCSTSLSSSSYNINHEAFQNGSWPDSSDHPLLHPVVSLHCGLAHETTFDFKQTVIYVFLNRVCRIKDARKCTDICRRYMQNVLSPVAGGFVFVCTTTGSILQWLVLFGVIRKEFCLLGSVLWMPAQVTLVSRANTVILGMLFRNFNFLFITGNVVISLACFSILMGPDVRIALVLTWIGCFMSSLIVDSLMVWGNVTRLRLVIGIGVVMAGLLISVIHFQPDLITDLGDPSFMINGPLTTIRIRGVLRSTSQTFVVFYVKSLVLLCVQNETFVQVRAKTIGPLKGSA
eukprot:Colp12_sorted_trinity150504_noHs@24558